MTMSTALPTRDSRLPPGPAWTPLGQLLPLRRDMIGFLAEMKHRYGDYVYFNVGHLKCCLIGEPEGVRTVLVTNQKNFVKGRPLELARELLGEGLLTAEGEHHLRHRRMIQPLLYRSRLPGYADAMVESAAAVDRRWQDGQTRDIMVDMSDLALVISGKTMFGADVSGEVREISTSLTAAMRLFTRVTVPFSEYLIRLPLPSSVRFYRARARLDATIYRLIRERQKVGTDGGDLLSLLLGLSNCDQARLPDPEIRDEALIFLLAAFDTTALSLTWTWYLLSQHPEVEAKLHEELDTVLGGRLPTWADMGQLVYTQKVVKEVLRLYPPGYLLARRAQNAFGVGGYALPKGTLTLMSPFLMQRDPRWFAEPERFDPDRWATHDPHHEPRYTYYPFGGGPRLCIGDGFAWTEVTLVLATLAQRWQPRLVPGHPVELWPLLNLRPRHGMRMTLHARHPARVQAA